MNPRQADEARAIVDKLYRAIQQQWPEFKAREGQRQMIGAVLDTMLNARTKATPCDGANLALIEAPTGTGKTLSYLLAAYAASVVLDKKVIVSTATVALQEQLHSKDLPRLAALAGADFTFDVLKGRQRYVCRRKLDRTDPLEDEGLFDEGEQRSAAGSSERLVRELHQQLQSGRWSGDRDEWAQGVDDATWRSIEADRHSCQGRKCSAFKNCAFYTARKRAEEARIRVANHALVLATLSTESNLIDPGNTLFVFDEGHHLAQVGVEQFTTEVSLAGLLRACERARAVLPKAARAMPGAPWSAQVEATGPQMREAEQTIARLLVDLDEDPSADKRGIVRFADGKLPASWRQTIEHLGALLASGHALCEQAMESLTGRDTDASQPLDPKVQQIAMELAPAANRIESAAMLCRQWLTHDRVPLAKWFVRDEASGRISLCASPLTAARALAEHVWPEAGAAVVTSATLTACGEFAMFQRLSGINRFPEHATVVVESPFDYKRQGRIHIPPMRTTPKDGQAYTAELLGLVVPMFEVFSRGQLALFTSRRQMEAIYEGLPEALRARVLVQGRQSRGSLLDEHRRRIRVGQGSILFGLQSFGEGLDLPGALCEHVLIDKIPFAPPDSPVDAALAEWLASQQRDAFDELTVPRAGVTLAQWTGRGIRTTTDHAVITICDKRLRSQSYGRRLLRGLPPMPVVTSLSAPLG